MITLSKKIINQLKQPQYYTFGIIGGTAFIIDTGTFTMLHAQLGYAISRMISILIAMTFAWLANRTFTFKTQKKISLREWIKYVSTNAIGAFINLSIFLSLCHISLFLKTYYLIPLMLATSVSMVSNFTFAKHYVFR